jgi:hypothetical protein
MKIKITDHVENTTRVIDYPFTLLQFVKIHFTAFGGIYGIEKTGANKYEIFERFDGAHIYTISKARKTEA